MNDRMTFRLGPLAGPLAAYCEKHGTTPSDAIRLADVRVARWHLRGEIGRAHV